VTGNLRRYVVVEAATAHTPYSGPAQIVNDKIRQSRRLSSTRPRLTVVLQGFAISVRKHEVGWRLASAACGQEFSHDLRHHAYSRFIILHLTCIQADGIAGEFNLANLQCLHALLSPDKLSPNSQHCP
jgi:hypothetical protein